MSKNATIAAIETEHLATRAEAHLSTLDQNTSHSHDSYRQKINQLTKQYPCLSSDDEKALAIKMSRGCKRSKEKLVLSNLRLVLRITRQYSHREGVSFADLFQDGLVGLLKAVEKYDWRRGHRFSTYACWWIQQAVLQSFAEHDRLIRLPGHVVTNLAKLKRTQSELEERYQRQPSVLELSKALDISPKRIESLLRLTHKAISLHAPSSSGHTGSDSSEQTLEETLTSDTPCIDSVIEQHELAQLVTEKMNLLLSEREKDIVRKRFLWSSDSTSSKAAQKWTLEALGQCYGITRESVRQSEQRAIVKIRSAIEF